MSVRHAVIASSDHEPADSRRRDERVSDVANVDFDMAGQIVIDPAAFPPPVATPPAHAAEPVLAERSPAARAGLASGLMLALRFVQARFLSVWGLLIAAALCPAQVFADFAVYSALANFIAIAALLRFEAVFFQNSDHDHLARAFRLAAVAGAGFLAVSTLIVAAGSAAGWVVAGYGALFLVSLASRAIIRLVTSEATAEGDFAAIGNINIIQALVQPGTMIALIWSAGATSMSLFAADAIGHAVSALYLLWRRRAALALLIRRGSWSRAELRESASRWRSAPRLLLPSALLSFGFMVAPLLALPYAANPLLAAHVALAMRLLEVPTQMFAAVSVPLALSSLRSRPVARRQSWVRFITLWLVVAAAGLFAAIALAALAADVLLDDTQWSGIGHVVAIMTLFYGGIALVTPLHEIAALSRHPRRQVAANAISLAAVAAVMVVSGPLSMALLGAVGVVSIARMLAHVQFAWTRFGVERLDADGRPIRAG